MRQKIEILQFSSHLSKIKRSRTGYGRRRITSIKLPSLVRILILFFCNFHSILINKLAGNFKLNKHHVCSSKTGCQTKRKMSARRSNWNKLKLDDQYEIKILVWWPPSSRGSESHGCKRGGWQEMVQESQVAAKLIKWSIGEGIQDSTMHVLFDYGGIHLSMP